MPEFAINLVWASWVVFWIVARRWPGNAETRVGLGAEILFGAVSVLGFLLLLSLYPSRFDRNLYFWHMRGDDGWGWALVALAGAGIAFSAWARVHLSRLWERAAPAGAAKAPISPTGPYRLVRHPIYSGLILAAFATAALQQGRAIPFAGAALLACNWYLKAKAEEKLVRRTLGGETYDAYARRTAMLVPFMRF